jgi:hypothetical protein
LEEAWDRGLGWWGPKVKQKESCERKEKKTVRIVGTQLSSNRITNEKKSDKNETTTIKQREAEDELHTRRRSIWISLITHTRDP